MDGTFEIRFHGRGGQGVASAAEMLSVAAFVEGRFGQAVPSFGTERIGVPVAAFCRICDQPVRLRGPILRPDLVVVYDLTLTDELQLFEGIGEPGYLLVNSTHSFRDLGIGEVGVPLRRERAITVPATEIAMRHIGRPLPNTALLGGLVALTRVVSLPSLEAAIDVKYRGESAERNVAAAREAYAFVRASVAELATA